MTKTHDRLSYVKGFRNWSNDDRFSLADSWSALSLRQSGPSTNLLVGDGPGGDIMISLPTSGAAYTQNFDTLSNVALSTTNNLTIPGWFLTETGGGARDNEQYAVDTGGSNTGDMFSYGSAGSTDRALGELRSGTLIPVFGATFTNDTGSTITSLLISYTGEQWRFGGVHSTVADKIDFQISFDATSLATGTWTDVNQLDFAAPITTGTVGALDGNAAANRTAISFNITSLTIAAGATFWIRWTDTDATGADDGLAVDDFSITPTAGAGSPGELSINDVTLAEGDAGATAFTFTVTRANGSAGAVGATWTLTAPGGLGNADAGDFDGAQLFTGTVSFADGDTSETITINVQGDNIVETDEAFTITLSAATGGATITDATGAGTITNDDSPGSLSINDVTQAEGNAGSIAFTFTVSRTGGSDGAVSADYTVTLPGGVGGADASDFAVGQVLTGTVSFAHGETSQTITLQVNGDIAVEPDETFTITLSNPGGGVAIGDGSGTGTITNDDSPPVASIADASVVEGNGGVSYLVFTVSLSHAAAGPVTVDFDTADGTALAGSDYVAHSGQVSFAAGETSQTVSIPIIGDTNPENAETFTVTLSSPSGATLGDAVAIGTITNDDGSGYFALSGGNFSQNWSNIGLITANDDWSGVPYIIGYLGDIDPSGATTNVDPRTLTGAALGAIDVIANQTNPNITNGGVAEFHITDPVVALQGSGTADAPSLVLFMDATGRADVRLQANLRDIDATADNAAQQVNVQYRTDPNGSWTNVPGAYFSDVTTGPSATQVTALDVTLPPGANGAATLEIRIMTTNAAGNDEWVGIDDIVVSSLVSPPSLSIADAAVFEGDAGNTPISFTVTRNGSSLGVVTANYTVTLGSGPFDANADDFAVGQAFSGMVSFADGQTTQTIVLNVDGDVGPEGDEGFTVTLSNAIGGTIADGVAIGTIVNDDGPPPLVTINDVTVTEGDSGPSIMTFTVTRTGGTGAFSVDYDTSDGSATAGEDYVATSGTLNFAAGDMSETISVTINGDMDSELSETLNVTLSSPTNFALITDPVGVGTILGDDPIFIHDIQGSGYFSPILLGEGVTSFNTASAGTVIVRAVVTAVDNDGPRQGYFITEETSDWDANTLTSEGIFVMTRNDAGVGSVVSGVSVGDIVTITAQVMEYQAFQSMPRTMLVNASPPSIVSSGNPLPAPVTLIGMPNDVLTDVTPDYIFSTNFDATTALGFFETVEGMMVTIPNMVVADGFVSTSGGRPFFQAYSLDSANPDQINSRGGYTIAGDPPVGPPDTPETGDDTNHGGRHLHDGDVNPDVIELDFTGWAMAPPPGLTTTATMGDQLGDVTGIIDFDFTDRKLFVTAMEPGGFVDGGMPVQETTALGNDGRSLTVATFNVENLDPGDGAARFTALANAIATNLNAPDIICIEEMQDNNGAAAGSADASMTWQMLVDALNLATGSNYQWVDQEPNGSEGGEPGGNIRVGFLYNTDRVQLGDLDASATLAERRQYTDRIGDGVRDAGDLIAFSDNMLGPEISASDWAGTRRSLLGEFTFNGNIVYVTANHWPAKGGSGEFWQFNQNLATGDPDNSGWAQRNQVAQDVYAMLNLIEGSAPEAGIVAGGDFNDFYFYQPLTTVTGYTMADGTPRSGGARFENLTLTLAEAERYTYTFDGRAQAIDHIIVNGLLGDVATYDVVHLNTGYNENGTNPALSDHDPGLSSFDYRDFSEVLNGTAGADSIDGFGGDDVITGGAGNDDIDGGAGEDTAVYAGNLADYTVVGEFDSGGNLIGFQSVTDNNPGNGDEGTDTLESIEILQFADTTLTLSSVFSVELYDENDDLVGTFLAIQDAIDAASADYRIEVGAGSYEENLVVDVEGLTINGASGAVLQGSFLTDNGVAGPLNVWLKTAAAYDASAGAGITIGADDVTVTGLTVTGFNQAVVLGNGSDGLTLDGVALESNFTGIHKPGAAAVTGFEMLGGSIADGHLGMDIVRDSGSAGIFDGVTIDGTSFADLNRKGIYVEALSNATIANFTMSNVGEFGGITATGALGAGGNGINLNLKYDDYANVTIENFTMTDVGSSDRDGAVADGHQNGGAIVVAARDDAPSYNGNPATLTNAVIRNGSIDGTSTGIALGEPGKQNATPDLLVENVAITDAQHSLRHGEIGNQSGATMTVEGTAGNDSLIASGNSDGPFVIEAGGGNDIVTTGSAADSIDGGAGSDQLRGLGGGDTLNGGAGNDLLDGGAGIDTAVFADNFVSYTDTLAGWVITSSEGNDFLENVEIVVGATAQRNLLVGSTGFATLQLALNEAQTDDNIRLAAGSYSGTVNYFDDSLAVVGQPNSQQNVTYATATGFGISVVGADLDDTITTADGNDVVLGRGGNDTISTGGGNDTLSGGTGNDTMSGGSGNDIYHVGEAGDAAIEAPGGGNDIIYSAVSYSLNDLQEVEGLATISFTAMTPINLTGNGLGNYMIGNDGPNQLDGKGGADVMVGRAGNDIYLVDDSGDAVFEDAAGGIDVIYTSANYALAEGEEIESLSAIDWDAITGLELTGNSGANSLGGNAGDNILDGKGGSDVLQGRGGEDTFAFTTAPVAGTVDNIFDFATGDTIALESDVFGLTEGPLDPNVFVSGPAATGPEDRIIYDQATGYLYFDADGNGGGAAILFASLTGAPMLTAADFTVI